MAFTALFFFLSSLPLFLRVQERKAPRRLPPGRSHISLAVQRLRETVSTVRHFREFIKFIFSFLIYNDGILMALNFASIIGIVLFGMNQTQLIVFMIIVQFTSAVGAYVFGLISGWLGCKPSLILSLLMMIAVVFWMIFNQTVTGYFIIGALAGFALTGVQSLSRTMAGLFAPERKSAEFFSFFAIAGKSSSFIGPLAFGSLAFRAGQVLEKFGYEPTAAAQMGYRAGLGLIVVFLLIGLVILFSVNEEQAKEAALQTTVPDGKA